MKMRPGQKIKLTSVEELLGVTNEESAMDLEISKIRLFKDHPFKVLDDEKMQDLQESIRINGILSPVLVRPIGNDIYEMVSGHRRMHAAMMLGISHPYDREMIEGMASLILETVISNGESIVIAGNKYPSAVVKSRFLKLDYSHIDYVLFCLKKNTTKINNIKKYLLAALFNAPSTIGSYYQAEVNHDAYGAVLNHNQGTSFLHDASSQYL